MAENFTNADPTTLNGAIGSGDTSITATSSTGAPAVNFRVRIENEFLLVTAVAGAVWTVTRGIEGSSAVAHADASAVTYVLTAGGLVAGIPASARALMKEYSLTASATVYIPDADIATVGAALIWTSANDGVGMMNWYRTGSFNQVIGIQAGNFVFRGSTFSGGTTGFSVFIESNSAAARLGIKNNFAYARILGLWEFPVADQVVLT